MPCRHQGAQELSSYSFLILTLDGGEWSASCPPLRFNSKGKTSSTRWTGGWVGLRAGLDRIEEKSFASDRDRTPVVQSVVRHYTDWATPSPISSSCNYLLLDGQILFLCSGTENSLIHALTLNRGPDQIFWYHCILLTDWYTTFLTWPSIQHWYQSFSFFCFKILHQTFSTEKTLGSIWREIELGY
jgi:hypothetical protein